MPPVGRHREERSDEAIHSYCFVSEAMDCFAALAMTAELGLALPQRTLDIFRHREERRDEAIHSYCCSMDCLACARNDNGGLHISDS